MPHRHRVVFFISDGTGITAEMLGHSLLTQFEGIQFSQVVIPFVDSPEKAEECIARIEAAKANSEARPVVFTTLVDDAVRAIVRRADALVLDFFETFLAPLEPVRGRVQHRLEPRCGPLA
jgi:[pyruvate, water dikinase]-phosphate phosphotransferase / [pyruvate, water dikinase] kinase